MSDALRAALEADLACWAFAAPPGASLTPRRVGAEVELIPVDAGSGRRCGLEPGGDAGDVAVPAPLRLAPGLARDHDLQGDAFASSCRPAAR